MDLTKRYVTEDELFEAVDSSCVLKEMVDLLDCNRSQLVVGVD